MVQLLPLWPRPLSFPPIWNFLPQAVNTSLFEKHVFFSSKAARAVFSPPIVFLCDPNSRRNGSPSFFTDNLFQRIFPFHPSEIELCLFFPAVADGGLAPPPERGDHHPFSDFDRIVIPSPFFSMMTFDNSSTFPQGNAQAPSCHKAGVFLFQKIATFFFGRLRLSRRSSSFF